MKILIATGIYPPSIGGPATYSKILFEELPERGIEAEVLSFDGVRHLPKIVRHFAYFFKLIPRALKADIVYAQDPVSVGLPALFVSKILRKKFLVRIAGDYAWEQYQQLPKATSESGCAESSRRSLDEFYDGSSYDPMTEIRKKIQTVVAKNADGIIVPSAYLKNILGKWGIDPRKIIVIYNAFESLTALGETYSSAREKCNFKGPTIVSVGRLVPWKGFSVLIDVVADISKTIKDIKLLIIGDGPDRVELQKKIEAVKAENTVILAGKMNQQDLFTHIKAADLFVLNTEYEGFSHQLLEVMALGTPIVTTKVGGNVELIEQETNGLLVAYNDRKALRAAILSILDNKEHGKKLAQAASQTVSSFTKEKMLEEVIKLFKTIV